MNASVLSRHTANVIYWDPILFHGTNKPLERVRRTILWSGNGDERHERIHGRLHLQVSSQQSFHKDAEQAAQSRYRDYVDVTLV